MIEIKVTKSGENFKSIEVSGHSVAKKKGFLESEKIEERIGENVICAAVSVLSQSLYIFCKKKKLIGIEKISDGFLKFDLKESSNESNSAFEMAEMGLINLRDQYPEEIGIVYLKGL